jgi:hypothetical protein
MEMVLGAGKRHREKSKQKQNHDIYRSLKLGTQSWPRAENSENNLVSDHQKIRDLRGAMYVHRRKAEKDSKVVNMNIIRRIKYALKIGENMR